MADPSLRWDEIDRFELRPRGHIPRLRIHLRDGRVKKSVGFLARSGEEEERCQAMFAALQERLDVERARQERAS